MKQKVYITQNIVYHEVLWCDLSIGSCNYITIPSNTMKLQLWMYTKMWVEFAIKVISDANFNPYEDQLNVRISAFCMHFISRCRCRCRCVCVCACVRECVGVCVCVRDYIDICICNGCNTGTSACLICMHDARGRVRTYLAMNEYLCCN